MKTIGNIRFSLLVVIGLFAAVLSTLFATLMAAESYRYAGIPWALDSPAGRCVVCHSLEKNGEFRVAPNLWGIVGAEKARNRSYYSYSAALLNKGGVWNETDIDQFLADANKYLPGTTKSIKVKDADERKKIIKFLKTLAD